MKPSRKSDSAHAELNSEREREKGLTAKLKKTETELRNLNREYKKSERQRNTIATLYAKLAMSGAKI